MTPSIFYHPLQEEAENDRVQSQQGYNATQTNGSTVEPNTTATVDPQIQYKRPMDVESDPGNRFNMSFRDTAQYTDGGQSQMQQLPRMDPRYQEMLDRYASSPEPSGTPVPQGFKQRALFTIGRAVQAMAQHAAQQPGISAVPQDDALATLASGAAAGLQAGIAPNQALKDRYYNQVLPAYYQQEAAKSKMRELVLKEAELSGKVGANSVAQANTQAQLIGRNIANQRSLAELNALPGKLKTEAIQRELKLEAEKINNQYLPEKLRMEAAIKVQQLNKMLKDNEILAATAPAKIQTAQNQAVVSGVNAKTRMDLINSQIARNNAPKGQLTTPQKAEADANEAWDSTGENSAYAAYKARRMESIKSEQATNPAYVKEMLGDEKAFEAATRAKWATSKERDKAKKDFLQSEKARAMRRLGGYQPTRNDFKSNKILNALDGVLNQ